MEVSLTDVIASDRWERALFTSFVFSSSFFETVILRGLRQGGCQQISVVVDAKGYRDSLVERRSSSIGQDIRLIPIALPDGIFHPKCAYLISPRLSMLAVGSGNLTFGGFGRNLEVLDVLTPKDAPVAFHDFAEFLGALERRIETTDARCPDLSWIGEFKADALRVGNAPGDVESAGQARILHSVSVPIIDQLESRCNRAADQSVTIISPYYDPDAKAVQQLTKKLGCSELRIGISPKSNKTSFPEAVARKWSMPLSAVWGEDCDQKRPLVHAKWIEVSSKGYSAVLTGSINATNKSLCTTDNIEVGVFRARDTGDRWTNWAESEFPKVFEPDDFSRVEKADAVVFAVAHGDGTISGEILGGRDFEGIWQGTLARPNGDSAPFNVGVKSNGSFSRTLSSDFTRIPSAGLQITLHRNETHARGWVHFEDILRLPRLPRLNIPSLLRVLGRQHTLEDEIALLEYFAINANRHFSLFSRALLSKAGRKSQHDARESDLAIDIDELRPDPTMTASSIPNGAGVGADTSSLDRIFSRLRHVLLKPEDQQVGSQSSVPHASIEVDGDAAVEVPDAEDQFQAALDSFDSQMNELIDSNTLDQGALRGLFVLWFEVSMYMLLVRAQDSTEALAFMREWLGSAALRNSVSESVDAVEQHLVSSVATLAATETGQYSGFETDLHDSLERFYRGAVPISRARDALLVTTRVPYELLLGLNESSFLNQGLDRILATPTLREQLRIIVEAAQKGNPFDESSPVFSGHVGREILSHIRSSTGHIKTVDQIGDRDICPTCFVKLSTQMAQHLSRRRIAMHDCGKLIVRLEP